MALVQALYCGFFNISMHLEAFLFNPLISHCIPLHGQSIIYLIISYLGTSKLFSDLSLHKQYNNEILIYKSLITSVFSLLFTSAYQSVWFNQMVKWQMVSGP